MTGSLRNHVATWVKRTQERRERAAVNRAGQLGKPVLVDRFGQEEADVMLREMVEEILRLAPEAPHIGRDGSPAAGNLKGAYSGLAVYRVVKRHGGSVEDAGEFFHRLSREQLVRLPKVIRSVMAWYWFSSLRRRKWERGAQRSQARRYPGDWVVEMVPAEGEDFDLGFDITECGIVKYLHAHDADEMTPYLCDVDYVAAEVLGYGLHRTKTLSWGCDRCDFRFSRHGQTTATWPPQFVERTCGLPQAPTKPTKESAAAS